MQTISKAQPTPLFLFSLPRSGSTLCQRILAVHKDIATVSEPHVLLYLLYSLRDWGVYSEFGHKHIVYGIQDFCASLPNGESDYLAEIRDFVLQLYAKAASGERYFLDKTPDYSLVVQDIIDLFPQAKLVFLWRNPLSVLSSINETFRQGRWSIYHWEIQLYKGLDNLVAAYQKYDRRICSIRYEDIILKPERTWQRVFAYLDLPFDPQILKDFASVKLQGRHGDPNVHLDEYDILTERPLQKWKHMLANPLRKAWCRQYLNWIGRERLAIMGYDLDTLIGELDALPFGLRFVGSDIFRMTYGRLGHFFEFQMFRQKTRDWRNKQRIYMHK